MAAQTMDWARLVAHLRDQHHLVRHDRTAVLIDATLILEDDREVTRRVRVSLPREDAEIVTFDVAIMGESSPKGLLEAAAALALGAVVMDGEDVPVVRHRLWRDLVTLELLDRTLFGVLEDAWHLEESLRGDGESAALFSHFA